MGLFSRRSASVKPSFEVSSWAEVQPHLRPVLRPRARLAFVESQSNRSGTRVRFATRSLTDSLACALMIPVGGHQLYVQDDMLAIWGKSFDEALHQAVSNVPDPGIRPVDDATLEVVGSSDQNASLLISILGAGALPFGSDSVFIAPFWDTLYVVDGTKDKAINGVLSSVIQSYSTTPNPVSPVPFVIKEGKLSPWLRATSDETLRLVRLAGLLETTTNYAGQQEILKADNDYKHLYINQHKLIATDEISFSLGACSKGLPSLIPRVDYVFFADPKRPTQTFTVAWDDVMGLALDHFVPRLTMFPMWQFDGWPSDDIVGQLQARALDPQTHQSALQHMRRSTVSAF